ncbi:hypothetical protein LTR84_001400 [Exophiala bonariae]|uniref:Carboxylic ester hydrolase n=1 Tax=Exophiala bonariae TaxID=1690606 RepID=A0AAV9NH02_9EURO|nr:hypothetical protein LTR84_001400 [Exophiala bonariae]
MRSALRAIALHVSSVISIAAAQTARGCQSCNTSAPTATIDSGSIIGRTTKLPDSGAPVKQFLGIPFAQPPIKDSRFLPPEPAQPWDEAYNATSQPFACMQYLGPPGPAKDIGVALFNSPPPPGESEDCLYLNVYVPEGGAAEKAVLFWIHGGSNRAGAASEPLYDGTSFAANHDIIVVAMNYRLGVFGFPRAPQLPLTERNLGALDQILALDWVQRNIRAFGGDPRKVTLMGESAGAMAVSNFINTYPDDPPFRAGVLQSGSSVVKIPPGTLNDDATAWTGLLEHLNCSNTPDSGILACVRAVPATALKEITETNAILFGDAVLDNFTVLEYPAEAWTMGKVAKVPILIGSTADDGSVFTLSAGDNVTAFIEASFGVGSALSQSLGQLYAYNAPATAGLTTGQQIIAQIATDATFRCTSGFVANLTSTRLDVPVWQYVFDAVVPSNEWEEYPGLGVYHASEIALIFGTYPRENSTEAEAALSQSMQKQFADFVKNPERGPGWDQWPDVGILSVNGTNAVTTVEDVRDLDAVCVVWDQVFALALSSASSATRNSSDSATQTSSSTASESSTIVSSNASTNFAGLVWSSCFGIAGIALLGLTVLL